MRCMTFYSNESSPNLLGVCICCVWLGIALAVAAADEGNMMPWSFVALPMATCSAEQTTMYCWLIIIILPIQAIASKSSAAPHRSARKRERSSTVFTHLAQIQICTSEPTLDTLAVMLWCNCNGRGLLTVGGSMPLPQKADSTSQPIIHGNIDVELNWVGNTTSASCFSP